MAIAIQSENTRHHTDRARIQTRFDSNLKSKATLGARVFFTLLLLFVEASKCLT